MCRTELVGHFEKNIFFRLGYGYAIEWMLEVPRPWSDRKAFNAASLCLSTSLFVRQGIIVMRLTWL